jgi:hypothetical protein
MTQTLHSRGVSKARKSAASLEREAKAAAKLTDPAKAGSSGRKRRLSRPSPSEVAETLPRPPAGSVSDAIDAWPTQAMEEAELSSLTEMSSQADTGERRAAARGVSPKPPAAEAARPGAVPEPPASGKTLSPSRFPPAPRRSSNLPDAATVTQAIRVVLWQTPEGVRVAPSGTRTTSPAVEAVLVGLDPQIDLTRWLTGR